MSAITLRGPSSLKPPGPLPASQQPALMVRGQRYCHAQLVKITNTAHVCIQMHKCTIVHRPSMDAGTHVLSACFIANIYLIVMGHHS